MQRRAYSCPRWAAACGMALGAAMLLGSCGGGSGRPGGGNGGGGGSGTVVGAPAVPSTSPACPANDISAITAPIYVSPDGRDSSGCGTSPGQACATIQAGIEQSCSGSHCGVLVRHGLYATMQTIVLREGVNVYGGCLFGGEADRRYRSVVQASPAPGTPAVLASGISSATVFAGIVVVGKDETASGTPSIAMAVSGSSGLSLRQATLYAGRGGDGATGATPSRAATGAGGNAPDAALIEANAPDREGGASCGSGGGAGGAGSDWRQNTLSACFVWCGCHASGGDTGGAGGSSGAVAGGGGGGPGGDAYGCTGLTGDAGQGGVGHAGSAGSCSTQGGVAQFNAWGSLRATTWSPGTGSTGGQGDVGSGGGGGGPGGLCARPTSVVNWSPYWGQPGGGGGAGGCGGTGGPGGQQGGASIALMLVTSAVSVDAASTVIVGGAGGNGGPGATGGVGGAGGSGGGGGNGNGGRVCYELDMLLTGWGGLGGPGGPGGPGGAGSGGAGGNGGPAIGIASAGGSAVPAGLALYPGHAGTGGKGSVGGSGGAGGCQGAPGGTGNAGGSATTLNFDLPLDSILLQDNVLQSGQSVHSPGGKAQLAMQVDGNLCLYTTVAVWCWSDGYGKQPVALALQGDGNLCLRHAAGANIACRWNAAQPWAGSAWLEVRDDGHVAITNGKTDYWVSP